MSTDTYSQTQSAEFDADLVQPAATHEGSDRDDGIDTGRAATIEFDLPSDSLRGVAVRQPSRKQRS